MNTTNIDYFMLYDQDMASKVTKSGQKNLDEILQVLGFEKEKERKRELLKKKLERILKKRKNV